MPRYKFVFAVAMLASHLIMVVPFDAFAKDKALVIGISRYQHAKNLRGPKNDIKAIMALLNGELNFDPGDIKILEDKAATKNGILSAFDEWLIKGTERGDRVFLYYSGHGEQLPDQSGDESEDNMDEAIIAYDATADHKNWLLDDEVAGKLALLDGRKIMAIFDSCHSGSVTRDAFEESENEGFMKKTPGWEAGSETTRGFGQAARHQKEGGFIDGNHKAIAFFAVAPQQEAIDDWKSDPNRPHGVFTEAIAQGVKGAADSNHDQEVSYAELLAYARQQSENYCQNYMKGCAGKHLTPMLEMPSAMRSADFKAFGKFAFEPISPPKPANVAVAVADQEQINVGDKVAAALPYQNEARLTLAMEPSAKVRLGQEVRYKIYSPRAGKLLVFDVAADNSVTQLFPNQYQANTVSKVCRKLVSVDSIAAGTEIVLPDPNCMGFTFKGQEPIGKGKIVAVLIEDAVNTKDLLGILPGNSSGGEKLAFEKINQPLDTFNQLGQRLDQVIHETNGVNRNGKRSVASINYEVIP